MDELKRKLLWLHSIKSKQKGTGKRRRKQRGGRRRKQRGGRRYRGRGIIPIKTRLVKI